MQCHGLQKKLQDPICVPNQHCWAEAGHIWFIHPVPTCLKLEIFADRKSKARLKIFRHHWREQGVHLTVEDSKSPYTERWLLEMPYDPRWNVSSVNSKLKNVFPRFEDLFVHDVRAWVKIHLRPHLIPNLGPANGIVLEASLPAKAWLCRVHWKLLSEACIGWQWLSVTPSVRACWIARGKDNTTLRLRWRCGALFP